MINDSAYYAYQRIQLFEHFIILTENRQLAYHNAELVIANNMAHDGNSKESVHEHLDNIAPYHSTYMLKHWYATGGSVPVINYIRHNAIKTFSIDTGKIHLPKMEGKIIHAHLHHPEMMSTLRQAHYRTLEMVPKGEMTIYRGIGYDSDTQQYIPHAVESWTTNIDVARFFSKNSHLENSIPHIFKATIDTNHLMLSHHARPLMQEIIPPDNKLYGKEEVIPFGDKIRDIERIV